MSKIPQYYILQDGDIMQEGDEMYFVPSPYEVDSDPAWIPIDVDAVGEPRSAEDPTVRRRAYGAECMVDLAEKLAEWAMHTHDGVHVKHLLREMEQTAKAIKYETGEMGGS